jgi:hypothetical protein
MTDTPNDPNDANPTTRMEPPSSTASAMEPPPSTASAMEPPPPPTPPAPPVAPSVPPSPPSPPPMWRSRGDDPGRMGTIILGAILLVIGLWFFADQTLELEMPRLSWSQLWPIFLIGLGAWIAIGSMRRR